jgi:endonuclease/exonuclease/phosphatase family metal-dependent hydrolase
MAIQPTHCAFSNARCSIMVLAEALTLAPITVIPVTDPDRSLQIMTFNIRQGRALDGANRWYRRRDLVFEVIRRYPPHVLGAQEVNPNQLDELLDALDGYGAVVHRRYGGLFGAAAPILFDTRRLEAGQNGDFWLSPIPDGKRMRAWDAAVPRICTWAVFSDRETGERFVVFNSHFDQRGVEARLHSANLVVQRMEEMSHLPRLFLCDLNANEQSEPLQIFLRAGYRDTFRVIRPDEAPFFTYHRFAGHRAGGRMGKIDYILCDDRWTVLDAAIVRDEFEGRLPSDHYPVTARLSLAT